MPPRQFSTAQTQLRLPGTIHGTFQGTAAAFQDSMSSQLLLIAAALLAVYIVLGMLYESYIHPITILSTIPSAGTGALLGLLLFKMELNVIGLVGILLLIGIVKKNAIMMIDFALERERQGKSPLDAIHEAALTALPADHDDHRRGAFGCGPVGFRPRHRLGTPPAARHRHRRRPCCKPNAHHLHDTSRLPLHGPLPSLAPYRSSVASQADSEEGRSAYLR